MKIKAAYTIFLAATSLALAACGNLQAPADRNTAEMTTAEETMAEPSSTVKDSPPGRGVAMETNVETEASRAETGTAQSEVLKETFVTKDKILELSGRGDLTWKDFEDYASQDIGSGLLILRYMIDDNFCLFIGGGGTDEKPMYIRAASVWDQEAFIDIRDSAAEEVETFFREHAHTNEYVGIRGHVKENRGTEVLVSSDTDDFPGVFWVGETEVLAADEELKGGTPVFILMEDTGRQTADGVKQFRAKEFVALPEDGQEGKADILITSAPVLTLTDALSSKYEPFEIWPGNSSWSVIDGGEITTIVACGAAPLDEMSLKAAPRLKLPVYYRLDEVYYTFSTTVSPDKLVIRRWNLEDTADEGAVPECVITYYCPVFGVKLMKGKVYEFVAEWKTDNLEQTGFGGSASYVLVTE